MFALWGLPPKYACSIKGNDINIGHGLSEWTCQADYALIAQYRRQSLGPHKVQVQCSAQAGSALFCQIQVAGPGNTWSLVAHAGMLVGRHVTRQQLCNVTIAGMLQLGARVVKVQSARQSICFATCAYSACQEGCELISKPWAVNKLLGMDRRIEPGSLGASVFNATTERGWPATSCTGATTVAAPAADT